MELEFFLQAAMRRWAPTSVSEASTSTKALKASGCFRMETEMNDSTSTFWVPSLLELLE